MFSNNRKTSVTLVLVFTLAIVSGCPAQKEAYSSYYDPMRATRIPLVLSDAAIALVIEDGPDGERRTEQEIAAILNDEPLIAVSVLFDGAGGGYTGVDLVPGASDEVVLDLIDRLNATPGVDWANPIVTRGFGVGGIFSPSVGLREAIIESFVAVFPATATTEAIETLNEEVGTQVEKVEETEEGLMYFLRAAKGNELSTLELANFYHEHSLTIRAYPQFRAFDES